MSTSPVETSVFQEFPLSAGMRLMVAPTPKFKRTRVMVILHDQLDAARASKGALLPFIQKRGTQGYPTGMDLERAAGELYDADLSGGVYKVGDRQLIAYSLDIVGDQYVEKEVFEPGLDLLAQMLYRPAREGDGLKLEYVDQEKRFQVGRLRALVNNKIALARHRCIEEMYKGEPFAEHELGSEDSIAAADPRSLLEHHQLLLNTRPIDVYVVGDVDPDRVIDAVRSRLVPQREEVSSVEVTRVSKGDGSPRQVVQEERMNQGWLILGLKTDIARSDPDRYGMMFLNGVLGGFVHSKLFANVREKASLAYTASSSYDANKGVLLALAGIDVSKYDQALDIMRKQIDDTLAGDFSDEVLEATRRGLRSQYRMRLDTADGRILFHAGGTAEGAPESIEEATAAIERVGKEDIVRAGERIRLDMIYFLKGSGMNEA